MAQAFGLVGQDLVEKGQLTPGQLDKAQKVASALERGEIDIRGLVECSGGKSGYSLLDFLITPARAGGDCTVPSTSAGNAFITLTQDEKIACIELLSGLAKDYLRKQLDGTGNAKVPAWVSEVAGQIRKIEVDYPNARELLISFGLAGDSIRELAIYSLGGEESVETYRQLRNIAMQYGEVAESAVSAAVDAVAAEKGLSAKDRADLKLLATTGVFAAVAMVGVKGGAASSKQGIVLSKHLEYSQKYGTAGVRELESGKIRYYGNISPASKTGEMAGRRYVHEYDPATNTSRGWHEIIDKNENIRQVRPEFNDRVKRHYKFDENGTYEGKW